MTGNCRPESQQLFAPVEGAMEVMSVGTEEYDTESKGLVALSRPMAVGS